MAELAAAGHGDAAAVEVIAGVGFLFADDGLDVIQDGDGHDDGSFCDWRLSVRSRCRGDGLIAGGGRAGGRGRVGDGDDFVSDGAELTDSPVMAAASGLIADAGVQESGDAVDLGASALAGGTGVQGDGLACFRYGDGRVPVEVVGELAQGTNEAAPGAGVGGVVLHDSSLS